MKAYHYYFKTEGKDIRVRWLAEELEEKEDNKYILHTPTGTRVIDNFSFNRTLAGRSVIIKEKDHEKAISIFMRYLNNKERDLTEELTKVQYLKETIPTCKIEEKE